MADFGDEELGDWETSEMRNSEIGRLRRWGIQRLGDLGDEDVGVWETAALERAKVIEHPTEEPARSDALPLVEGHRGSDSLPGVTRTTRTDSMWPAVCKDCVSAKTLGTDASGNKRTAPCTPAPKHKPQAQCTHTQND